MSGYPVNIGKINIVGVDQEEICRQMELQLWNNKSSPEDFLKLSNRNVIKSKDPYISNISNVDLRDTMARFIYYYSCIFNPEIKDQLATYFKENPNFWNDIYNSRGRATVDDNYEYTKAESSRSIVKQLHEAAVSLALGAKDFSEVVGMYGVYNGDESIDGEFDIDKPQVYE